MGSQLTGVIVVVLALATTALAGRPAFALLPANAVAAPTLVRAAPRSQPGASDAPTVRLERSHLAPSPDRASTPAVPSTRSAMPVCQQSWSPAPTPNGAGNSELNATAAVSGVDIWAVGDHINSSGIYQTLAEHWNGTGWTVIPTPNVGPGDNHLNAVAPVATNDVWAVGLSQATISSPHETLTEHWDGVAWSVVASLNVANTSDTLFGVAAISANDVIAVGRAFTSSTVAATLMEQWNGSSWSIMQNPIPDVGPYTELFGIDALSATDVWAVGAENGSLTTYVPFTEHFNGTAWSVDGNPNTLEGGFLFDISATGPTDLWSVGGFVLGSAPDQTLIEHSTGLGNNWSIVQSPSGYISDLFSVVALASNNVWAVGQTNTGSGIVTLAEQWNGTSWSIASSANAGVGSGLFGAAAIAPGEMWAVGSDATSGTAYETLAENFCAPPTVTSVAPNIGPPAGGTSVVIGGTGFSWATGVTFGTTAASSFTVNSDTQITATSPTEDRRIADVRVSYFAGASATAAADHFTFATAPFAPLSGVAIGGEGSALVHWSPGFDGGSPITGYTLIATPGSATTSAGAGATSAQLTGLIDGTAYTISVAAFNRAGTGPGAASNTVTPGRGAYVPLTPARILDTRTGIGSSKAPLGPNATLTVQVSGEVGVPSTGASAVILNVTVTGTTAASYLTVYPTGVPRPLASNLNWTAGKTVPNLVEVALGVNGQVTIYNAYGNTDVIFDVAGYVATPTVTPPPAGRYNPVVPNRVLDTRYGTGGVPAAPLGPNQSLQFQVTGAAGVPATGVAAVVLNVTVTGPTAPSYLTVWPAGANQPLASNLNFLAGRTVPNRVVVKLGTGGKVAIYNAYGNVHVIADVGGWFTDGTTADGGSQFIGVPPARILDTRAGTGGFSTKVGPGQTIAVSVAGAGGVPLMAAIVPPIAVVLNVTVTNPTAPSYLTVTPDGTTGGLSSDLNDVSGLTVANLVVVKLGADGKVDFYNAFGSTDVIADVVGWYG